MDTRTKEVIRYLGYGKSSIDEKTYALIQESFAELEKISEPKCVYRIFELSFPQENELQICNLHINSKNLNKNLRGCEKVVLLGTTLGSIVDRKLRTHELTDIARAVVMQACAATMLEEYCDEMQEKIARQLGEENLYLRPRFSPGYGDFSITHQKELLEMLDAPKRIGLTMTDAYMLAPTKSVTAIIGVSKTKEPCHRKGCEECTKADCLYRRS